MSTLTERLRGVLKPGGEASHAERQHRDQAHLKVGSTPVEVGSTLDAGDAVAETLGGEWSTANGHPFLVVDRKYAGGHRHGQVSILDALPPDTGVWPRLDLLAGRGGPPFTGSGRLLFLDLETTGLAGGAGTYAFLVGCAWFDGAAFRVRQFFLSSFAAERAILDAVTELAGNAAALVTFNGKTFDVPLIDTRFSLHRLASPFERMPHVDMLHAARRFWRQTGESFDDASDADVGKGSGCRLSELEQSVCGHEREGDVPGFEIPARYFHYVRSGDARGLHAVLEHNRLDLISLALLTARAAQMLEDGPTGTRTAREALGLGRVYERAGCLADARAAYAHAAGLIRVQGGHWRAATDVADETTRAEALRAFATLSRRERRFEDAAIAWQCALDMRRCPAQVAREASEALAVHHEHRARDLEQARRFAMQSLQYRSTPTRTQALRHRVARLDRKMGRPTSHPDLF